MTEGRIAPTRVQLVAIPQPATERPSGIARKARPDAASPGAGPARAHADPTVVAPAAPRNRRLRTVLFLLATAVGGALASMFHVWQGAVR